jgi:ABC-type glycerol-3-phosphate transport system substrate-binding protein
MKSQPIRSKPLWRSTKIIAVGVAAAIALVGCASVSAGTGSTSSFKEVKQVPKSTITVWADATRVPAVQAYEKSHPSVKIKLVTYSTGDFQTKINLLDKAGGPWPDVVFSQVLTDVGWTTSGKTPFAAPLNDGIFPASKIKGFAPTALDPCMVDGTLYCVRNDLAQGVLWYNKTLMDKFGYSVPTTWEQYEALGAKLAKEHPGYILGSVGDSFAADLYFWGGKCPANVLKGKNFSSDLTATDCTKMATLLDNMIANGSVTKDSVFGTTFPAAHGDKTLALVGPSWYGQYVFNSALKIPAGQVAAANPLSWKGESAATGNVGGGVWYISSHSKNLAAGSALVNWLTTSNANQAGAPTYPAYAAAAKAWLANPANSSYFAGDVSGPFTKAAGEVWSGWSGISRADPSTSFGTLVIPGLISGKTITEQLPAWQTEINNLAGTVGYTVKK